MAIHEIEGSGSNCAVLFIIMGEDVANFSQLLPGVRRRQDRQTFQSVEQIEKRYGLDVLTEPCQKSWKYLATQSIL